MKAKIAKKLCKHYSAINKTLLKPLQNEGRRVSIFSLKAKNKYP